MLDATDVQVSFALSLHFAQVSSGKGCLENPLQRKAVAVPGSTDANLELTLAEMGMSSPSSALSFPCRCCLTICTILSQ